MHVKIICPNSWTEHLKLMMTEILQSFLGNVCIHNFAQQMLTLCQGRNSHCKHKGGG